SALLKALLFLFDAQKPFTLQSLYDRRYISMSPDSIIFFIGLDTAEFLSGKFLLLCALDCSNQRCGSGQRCLADGAAEPIFIRFFMLFCAVDCRGDVPCFCNSETGILLLRFFRLLKESPSLFPSDE